MTEKEREKTMIDHRVSGKRTGVIHLINPKTDSLTTRPLYLNRALYSPLAGLLAVGPPFRAIATKSC